MIVLDMMKKQSYGFNTFAGLRVGEIQQKTNLDDWCHIPSKENIADILTKGATPDKLAPGSPWQCGPAWLSGPTSAWPVTPPSVRKEADLSIRDEVAKFYRKQSQTSVARIMQTFVSGRKSDNVKLKSKMAADGIDGLIVRCGDLEKLVRCVAYVMRVAGRTHRYDQLEKVGKEIDASEYTDAYNYLVYWEDSVGLECQ